MPSSSSTWPCPSGSPTTLTPKNVITHVDDCFGTLFFVREKHTTPSLAIAGKAKVPGRAADLFAHINNAGGSFALSTGWFALRTEATAAFASHARTSNTVVPRAMSFIPKLVVISGASKGIGLAFANQLLRRSSETTIIAASRSGTSSGLEKLQNEFGAGRVFPMACDITSQEQCKAMAAQIKAEHDNSPSTCF